MATGIGEPTYAGYQFYDAYLTHNGKRVGIGTMQGFEFVPDPDTGELHGVKWGEIISGATFTVTCDWDMSSADDFWEELYPELRWQAFERSLDRRLRRLLF